MISELFVKILFGLVIGSFLNVLIYRLNVDGTPKFWRGRSLCPKCKHQLAWRDNIPLFSFLFLRGCCRYCRKPISWQYPVVELLTAIFFVLSGFHPVMLAIGSVLIVIFFSDLIYGLIPDEMIIVGVVLAVILAGVQNLLVGLITALPFFILAKFQKMGFGDVTLAFLLGFLLGWPKIAVALWSGFIIGGLFAVVLLALKKTKLSATIPLGPFLILGIIIAALWSNELFAALVSSR